MAHAPQVGHPWYNGKRCTSLTFGFNTCRGFGSFRFNGFGSDRLDSDLCDLGLTMGFLKTVE